MAGDDDEEEAVPHPIGGRNRHDRMLTPNRGVPVLDAELQNATMDIERLQNRVGKIEQWKGAIAGVQGQPGALSQLVAEAAAARETVSEAKAEAKAGLTEHKIVHTEHDRRLTELEHSTFKIIATAAIASSVVGGAIAIILHVLGGK